MFNTVTTGLSITPSAISHFKWGWDSNPWVPLMFHNPLQPHRHNLPMFSLRLKNPPDSLSGFSTSTNRSMRFCRNPMLSTRNAMINTGFHTSFKLETKSGYICRRSISSSPIKISIHFAMGLTLSPRDESLSYVQHSYNKSLHSSTDHSPFQVGLGIPNLGTH